MTSTMLAGILLFLTAISKYWETISKKAGSPSIWENGLHKKGIDLLARLFDNILFMATNYIRIYKKTRPIFTESYKIEQKF